MKNPSYSFFKKKFALAKNFLLYLSLFILPFQTSKYYFLKQSYILGVKKDLLAPALYFKYIVILLLIFFYSNFILELLKKYYKKVIILTLFLFLNFIFSQNKPITLYKIFQLFLFFSFALVLFKAKGEKLLKPKFVLLSLLFSGIIELFLSLYQLKTGASLQGLFYFLGERKIDLSSPAVSKTMFFGRWILRPYATFSHPNSLGAFYLFLYFLSYKKFFKDVSLYLLGTFRLICSLLVLLSFSKVIIFTFLLINLLKIIKVKKCFICKTAQIFSLFVVSGLFFSSKLQSSSLFERVLQFFQAKEIFFSNWLFGVGLGAYLTALSKQFDSLPYFLLQPVHNSLFLVLTEAGVLVIPVFYYLLKGVDLKKVWRENKELILVVFLTSLFDHYWWTLPQNLFILGLGVM